MYFISVCHLIEQPKYFSAVLNKMARENTVFCLLVREFSISPLRMLALGFS